IVRLVQRRTVSGEQASELPRSGRALRSVPLPAMLTRSIVPTGTDEWAASIPGPAARPATIATAPRTATHRRPKPPRNPSSRFIPQPPALDVTVTSHARTGPKAEHAFSFSTRKRAFLPKGTKRRKKFATRSDADASQPPTGVPDEHPLFFRNAGCPWAV